MYARSQERYAPLDPWMYGPSGEVLYPETDGKPMAETDTHIQCIIDVRVPLESYFADVADVYVSGNTMLYYEEGNPREAVSPDVLVVRGVAKRQRRVYKVWEEGRAPDWVLEVTSRGTRWDDVGNKRGLYQALGVQEYFLYDPLAEYLRPPLQGFRLEAGVYQAISPGEAEALQSEVLGLELVPDGTRLRLRDPASQRLLPTTGEEAAARRAAEAQAAEEAAARRAAEARAAALSEELERLRAALARGRG